MFNNRSSAAAARLQNSFPPALKLQDLGETLAAKRFA